MACFGGCCKATATNSPPPSEVELPNVHVVEVPNQNPPSKEELELLNELVLLENVCAGRVKRFTIDELKAATDNFHPNNSLGKGGYGEVFRGKLESNKLVAVKKADPKSTQGTREFVMEVKALVKTRHPNLVELIGYCKDHKIIVYDFMALGCLAHHLYDVQPPLNWQRRMNVVRDIVHGLWYLHVTCVPPIIHRDLKPSNILLNENYEAKLSDFGLAREAPTGDNSRVKTNVRGSFGYIAPEYATTGLLSMEADIYSFGAVLLELITGRKALDYTREEGKYSIVEWVYYLLKTDRSYYEQLVHPNFQGEFPLEEWDEVFNLALSCIRKNRHERPNVTDIATTIVDFTPPSKKAPTMCPTSASSGEASCSGTKS